MSRHASQPLTILIADDHALFASSLAGVIDSDERFVVVGQAADGAEAITLAALLSPDIVLMDVDMPCVDGIRATRAILESRTAAGVVVVSGDHTAETAGRARAAGAAAYVFKGCPSESLFAAIEEAAARPVDAYAA
jgi:DNA-binding NarL/FixJ family response regulator